MKTLTTIFISSLYLITALVFSAYTHANENTHYIADIFYVPLRSGPSYKHKVIVKGMRTGTAVKLIKTDESTGYSLVETQNGKQGWLENQYLSPKPIARILLTKEKEKNKTLQLKLAQLSTQNEEITTNSNEASREIKALTSTNQTLSEELASIKKISSNTININAKNKELLEKNEKLKLKIDQLVTENARLSDQSNKAWFIRGALAVAIGALLTVIIPRFKPKSKNSEWR